MALSSPANWLARRSASDRFQATELGHSRSPSIHSWGIPLAPVVAPVNQTPTIAASYVFFVIAEVRQDQRGEKEYERWIRRTQRYAQNRMTFPIIPILGDQHCRLTIILTLGVALEMTKVRCVQGFCRNASQQEKIDAPDFHDCFRLSAFKWLHAHSITT
jgi:hypothetical protein